MIAMSMPLRNVSQTYCPRVDIVEPDGLGTAYILCAGRILL